MKKQCGYLMFELVLVLAIAGLMATMVIKKQARNLDETRAQADGTMIAQVNNAIRKRIADEGTNMVVGTYTGVDWLHDTTCLAGLASKTYLPCYMSGEFYFNLTPVTTVTNSSGNVSASTNFGAITTGTQTRNDLASLAVLAANNENIHGETPIAGTFYSYQVNASGQLLAVTTYDAGLDQWLRTDGTNTMKASLDLGDNQIKNLGPAIAGSACTGIGLIAQQGGAILSCVSGFWKGQGSDFWRDPVNSYGNLPAGDPAGTVRLTKDSGRAFSWVGGIWRPLSIDQNGDMTIPGKVEASVAQLNNNYAEGTACTTKQVGTTYNGQLLSCVSGVWKKVGGYSQLYIQEGRYPFQGGSPVCAAGWTQLSYFTDKAGDYGMDSRPMRLCGK